jgi:hypothetical protein
MTTGGLGKDEFNLLLLVVLEQEGERPNDAVMARAWQKKKAKRGEKRSKIDSL